MNLEKRNSKESDFGKAAAANTEYAGIFENSCICSAVFGIIRNF